MNNPFYVEDICTTIFKLLNNMKMIIHLESLSIFHYTLITKYPWEIKVDVVNDNILEFVLYKYNFKNLDIDQMCDVNKFIDRLKKCDILGLSGTKITNDNVKKLTKCKKLDLSYTKAIDETVGELINCDSIDLSYTDVTDMCIKKLINCRHFELYGMDYVTDTFVEGLLMSGSVVYK